MRHFKTYKVDSGNSMLGWWKVKNPLIVMINFTVISVTRILPSLMLKRVLLRLIGVKIGKNVSVGLMVMFDIFYPERITIGDNTVLGYNCTILCHEFLIGEYRIGKVDIGKNVMIGANSTLLAGVTIADGAVVSACSLVNKNVETDDVVGGVPIKHIKG